MAKKFYWLKLRKGYFATRAMKKMRKSLNGEVMTIVYLKLQLEALETDGVILLGGYEETVEEELSLLIDEEPEHIKETLDFLEKHGLAFFDGNEMCLPEVVENTGSETDAAERMRRFRERENAKRTASVTELRDSYADVTTSYTEKIREELNQEGERKSAPSHGDEEAQAPSLNNKFTLEIGWDYTLKKYPRKTNLGNAREIWFEMVTKIPGAEKETARDIHDGMMLYVEDYQKNNPDDTDYRFILSFGKWLKQESSHWIKLALQYRAEREAYLREQTEVNADE